MADNVNISQGDGSKVLASDDVGGLQHQRVKPTWGADGVGNDVNATTPLPVQQYQGGSAVDFTTGTPGVPAGGVASVQGFGYDVATTITRPANVTPYSAGDVVGGAFQITAIGPGASSIFFTGVQLELDIAAVPSGMTSFTLYLYNVTPPSALADNAAWDLPSGDRASFLGSISLGAPVDLGSTLYVETSNINKQIKLASANLFGYLVTTGGYTPANNSEVYKVTSHAVGV